MLAWNLPLLMANFGEAYDAYWKKKGNVGEEIADVVIYLLGLSEILGIDLEKELLNKVEINKKRVYKKIDGVVTKVEKKEEN